jgi:hypothetical protein
MFGRFFRHLAWRASVLITAASISVLAPITRAEYLGLHYSSQFDLGGDVADSSYPSAGVWDEYRDDNTRRNTCSAVRIESNIQDNNQYILTAARCIIPTARGSFRNGGLNGPEQRSASRPRHLRYDYDSSANDIALGVFPLDDLQNQYPPIGLARGYTLPDGMTFYAVGSGYTGWNGANNTGAFTTKRNGFYAVDGFERDKNRFTFPRPDGVAATDPRRHLCHFRFRRTKLSLKYPRACEWQIGGSAQYHFRRQLD